MNKADFIKLSYLRLKEAEILLRENEYSGAYFLSGYSLKCALKAGIAGLTQQFDFPDKNFANKVYTHKLEGLISALGLKIELQDNIDANQEFAIKWNTVND